MSLTWLIHLVNLQETRSISKAYVHPSNPFRGGISKGFQSKTYIKMDYTYFIIFP